MVFGWFKGGKDDDPDDLLVRKEFKKAIELLEGLVKAEPHDNRLRQKLADAYAADGQTGRAVSILEALADSYANDGFVGKAIAVLKKIQKVDPSRTDIEMKLAQMVEDSTTAELEMSGTDEIGFEEIGGDFALGETLSADDAAPGEETLSEQPGDSTQVRTRKAVERNWKEIAATPLFTDFTKDELVAVIRGMRLRKFEDGDIIVTEGEPGTSLFVLTTGRVKVFTKTPTGQHVHLAELGEGDFFGEVSVLTGKPRTATITAAEYSEALELQQGTLEAICETHPRVRQVLQSFYQQRAERTVEAMIASLR